MMSATRIICRPRRLWCAALAIAALACKGTEPPELTSGAVQVTAATAGADLDADGYTVVLDSGTAVLPVAVNGTATFSQLSLDVHPHAERALAKRSTTATISRC
jgi:hypothetical protein